MAGASLGGWGGLYLATRCDLAELVRHTKLRAPCAHAVLSGLGFSGNHYDLVWGWNALLVTF